MRLSPAIFKSRRSRWSQAAFTLPELYVSSALGTLVLISMSAVFLFMNRSLNGAANYEELNRQSRQALDLMSRDIRQAACLTNFTPTSLTFTNQDGTLLNYTWDGSNYLTYTNGTLGQGGIILSNCLSLKFDIYLHTPVLGTTMTFAPAGATNCMLAKVIVVNWICCRTNYSIQTDSESVQTAKIVLRN
jgi:type II secretory pathway component PulJ